MSYRVVNCEVIEGLAQLNSRSVHCCVTSPPYWQQRDYGHDEQIGQEADPYRYVENLVRVFDGVHRVLRDDGTAWLNLGDTYSHKSPAFVPQLAAMALSSRGWKVRQDIIWHKPSAMPESVRDRFSRAHEHLLLLTKSHNYYFDPLAAPEYRKDVWTIPSKGFKGAHFAVMPEKLAEIGIEVGTSGAGCCGMCQKPLVRKVKRTRVPTRPGADTKATENASVQGNRDPQRHVTHTETLGWESSCKCQGESFFSGKCVVLDPFAGSGTTLAVSERLDRDSVGIEINSSYCELIHQRLEQVTTSRRNA
jgi:site-specific DNA-methyltransferase (adenine-specific)